MVFAVVNSAGDDALVMVEYGDPAGAYKLLDGGWRVVEVQPRFCLIRCMEEETEKLPGAVKVADGPERVYLAWYPKGLGLPEAEGVRTITAPGAANLAIGNAADVLALATMGAELKYVGYKTVRPPAPAAPLRPVREDRFVRAILENITPERYQVIVETLSVGVTPSRYSHSPLIVPATNYIQTRFWDAGLENVERWDYTYDPNDNDYVTSKTYSGSTTGSVGWPPTGVTSGPPATTVLLGRRTYAVPTCFKSNLRPRTSVTRPARAVTSSGRRTAAPIGPR
jgi:hypothetical protein